MKRKLVTYLPIAVLAIGLLLGMAAALMALRSGHTGPVEASVQQFVDNGPQVVYLGSANDSGGGDTSIYRNIVTATLTHGSEDLGAITAPQYNLIFPIADQSGSRDFDVSSNGNLTSTIQPGQHGVESVTINDDHWIGPASLQSGCSQQSIDGSHNPSGALLGTRVYVGNEFNHVLQRTTPARINTT